MEQLDVSGGAIAQNTFGFSVVLDDKHSNVESAKRNIPAQSIRISDAELNSASTGWMLSCPLPPSPPPL